MKAEAHSFLFKCFVTVWNGTWKSQEMSTEDNFGIGLSTRTWTWIVKNVQSVLLIMMLYWFCSVDDHHGVNCISHYNLGLVIISGVVCHTDGLSQTPPEYTSTTPSIFFTITECTNIFWAILTFSHSSDVRCEWCGCWYLNKPSALTFSTDASNF